MTEPRKFTTKPNAQFTVDDELFEVLGSIPAEELAQLLDLQEGLSGEGVGIKEQYGKVKEIFAFTMLPDSWARFEARLADRSRPVDFNLLLDITNWLSGEIWSGKGPTPPQSPSTESPDPTGTSSTDGQPPEVSTLSEPDPTTPELGTDTSTSSGTGEPTI